MLYAPAAIPALVLLLPCTLSAAAAVDVCNYTVDKPQPTNMIRGGTYFHGSADPHYQTVAQCAASCCATPSCRSFSPGLQNLGVENGF